MSCNSSSCHKMSHVSLIIWQTPSRAVQYNSSREEKRKEWLHPWEMRRWLLGAINTSGWDGLAPVCLCYTSCLWTQGELNTKLKLSAPKSLSIASTFHLFCPTTNTNLKKSFLKSALSPKWLVLSLMLSKKPLVVFFSSFYLA